MDLPVDLHVNPLNSLLICLESLIEPTKVLQSTVFTANGCRLTQRWRLIAAPGDLQVNLTDLFNRLRNGFLHNPLIRLVRRNGLHTGLRNTRRTGPRNAQINRLYTPVALQQAGQRAAQWVDL